MIETSLLRSFSSLFLIFSKLRFSNILLVPVWDWNFKKVWQISLWFCETVFFLLFQDVLSDKDKKLLLCLLFTILQILCIIFQVRGVVFANVENVFVKTITLERIAGKLIALLLPRIAWAPIGLVESYLNR